MGGGGRCGESLTSGFAQHVGLAVTADFLMDLRAIHGFLLRWESCSPDGPRSGFLPFGVERRGWILYDDV
jgi:hypothetical protein